MLKSNSLTRTIFTHFYFTWQYLSYLDNLLIVYMYHWFVLGEFWAAELQRQETRKDNFLDSTKPTAHSLVLLYSVSRTKNTLELRWTKDHMIWHLSKYTSGVLGRKIVDRGLCQILENLNSELPTFISFEIRQLVVIDKKA